MIWEAIFSVGLLCTTIRSQHVHIGGVLSSQDSQLLFKDAVERLNARSDTSATGLHFNSSSIVMDSNPIRSALAICEEMIPKKVHVIIASHPPASGQSPISVSYTCGYYGMPVIGIYARDSAFTDKVSLCYKFTSYCENFFSPTCLQNSSRRV